ncbi:MAG: signal peptide prediction [Burkholderiaceae bacterium]|nr:signal peptide prediction [Burkholderiaceae bacterium]
MRRPVPRAARGPGRWRRGLRLAWAAPATLLGVALALPLLLGGGRLARHEGVLEVCAPDRPGWAWRWVARVGIDAITFGHLVIARSPAHHAAWRAHERVHVRQYERWGPLFLLAYPAESLWQWLRGGCPYRDNRFEVQARQGAGEGGAQAGARSPGG